MNPSHRNQCNMMNELQSQRPRTVHLCNRTYESKSQTSQCNMMNEPQSQKSQCNIMNEPQSQISRVNLRPAQKEEKFTARTKLSQKDRYQAFRKKLFKDKNRYGKFKRKDSLDKRRYRKSFTDEQRKIHNEKTKLRMRAYRQRQKEKGIVEKPTTRQKIMKLRDYWRKKKQEQRSHMTNEDRRSMNEKRRAKYRSRKRLFEEAKSNEPSTPVQNRRYLPKTAEKFADTIENAVENSTPRRRKLLMRKGLVLSPEERSKRDIECKVVSRVKHALQELKKKHCKEGRKQYQQFTRNLIGKYTAEHSMRRALGIKWEYWQRVSALENDSETEQLKRSDAFSESKVENIQTFYQYESVTLPTKKTVSNKSLNQKKVLTETIQQIHKRFLNENPDLKVSLSQFRKLRPKEVLTVKHQKFMSCLCEYCLNAQFKIDSINQAMKYHKIDLEIESKYHAVAITLCDKLTSNNERSCLERKCEECETSKLKTFLNPLIQADDSKEHTWKKWKLGLVGTASTSVKRQILVEEKGSLSALIDELLECLEMLALHLFTARWQYKQFNNTSKNVPENVVVTIADFSENYRCVSQDEIQSAYYSYIQVSVFPMIAYYKCPDCEDVVQESAVFISDDLNHDAMAVNLFSKLMFEHISSHVKVEQEIQFSDGCAAQFKSKVPFFHVAETVTHKMERAFFGSRHGKSPCDALGGLIKKQAETHVRSRKGTIQSAKALYNFCHENLTQHTNEKCEHKKRVFFYVDEVQRSQLPKDLKTLKGTRQVHHVRRVAPGVVQSRFLSCFCKVCLGAEEGKCYNESYVGEWEYHSLVKQSMEPATSLKQKKSGEGKCKTNKSGSEDFNKFGPLPDYETRTFVNTSKSVDMTSLTLLPNDIPMESDKLHPAIITADGNCLPRSASLFAYGNENQYKEMRERIVIELSKNADMYLDDNLMKRGMDTEGNHSVAKTFASYSNCYTGNRLNKNSIKKIYNEEILCF